MTKSLYLIIPVLLTVLFSCADQNETIPVLAGRYNSDGGNGINIYAMNLKDGSLARLADYDAGPDPAYLCISKKNDLVYAANEVMNFKAGTGGGLTTLVFDAKTRSAEKVSEFAIPNGSPCFISLSPENDYLFLANYTGSSITVVKLDEKGIPAMITDSISYPGTNGKVSHPHMISFDPAGKRLYQTDLGLDQLVIYNFDRNTGKLQQIQNGIVTFAEGSGPRHFAFNKEGTKIYVINELNSTISVFEITAGGEMKILQTITTLKEGFTGKSFCADIHIGKNGDYLYGSNRGENTIVSFRIEKDGLLSLSGHSACGGDWPRNFVIDPTGKYLLAGNQRSGNISVFEIDENTGLPKETRNEYILKEPACLKFLN